MVRQVVDRELRRFVVRLQDPATGQLWGSGVLVAPGWVLTCAHVVRDADTVAVVVDRRAAADGSRPPPMVDGMVRARSAPPPKGSRSAFWPYPDLAVVQLDGWSGHVCAPLVPDEPSRSAAPHSWGFGRREEGVEAVGGPASFSYVGQDADGFLQLQAGEAPPGLSGAPLICPTRRGVVGLMSVSRSVTSPRGGWASPVAALTEAGVDDQLTQLGRQLVEQNVIAARRDRDAWAATIQLGGALDTVDRYWVGAMVEPQSGQPSTMLRAEFGVVPYLPHGDELDRIAAWCSDPMPVSVAYLEGAGGVGKTRFAIEACRQLERRGWVTGFLPADDRGAATLDAPRLLVVDYVDEHDTPQLGRQLAEMTRAATPLTPARLLLLSRPAAGSPVGHAIDLLKDDASGAALSALDQARDLSGTFAGLALEQQQVLYEAAITSFGRTWFGDGWTPSDQHQRTVEPSEHARPLDVLFEAFDDVLTGTGDSPAPGRVPVDRALDHEKRHWRRRYPELVGLLPLAVALATLCGARDEAEAEALLDLIPEAADEELRGRLSDAVRELYPSPDLWNPLRPDRLGEALVSHQLAQGLVESVLRLASYDQVSRALTVLVRVADNVETRELLSTALLASHDGLTERCVQPVTPDRQQGRVRLLDALARADAALLRTETVLQLPADVRISLSASLDDLGTVLRDYGRASDAQVLLTLALAIDAQEATVHPDIPGYQRSLGLSHQRLGDLDYAAGRITDAAEHYHRSLNLAETLTRLNPDNASYQQDLGLAHQRLGDLDRTAGRITDATEHHRAYLSVAETLTHLNPDNPSYQQDLGLAHQQLGDLDRDAGRIADAAEHYRHYLAAAEALTSVYSDNPRYRRGLGLAHQRLGDLDRSAGRTADATEHHRAYLSVAETLTRLDPANASYQQDLGLAHQRLGDLDRAAGRTAAAAEHYHQFLNLAETLTRLDPANASYQQGLGMAHQRLGDLDRAAGRTAHAAEHYRAYLSVSETLTRLDPDTPSYQQGLGLAHQRLGDLDYAADRPAHATEHYRAYLSVAETVTRLDPDNASYQQGLGLAHQRLGDLDRAAGRTAPAAEHYRHYLAAAVALTTLDPDNASYRQDLGLAHQQLGDLDHAAGRPAAATEHYRHYLAAAETLTQLDPVNPSYQQDLGLAHQRLGDLDRAAGRTAAAAERYHAYLGVAETLTRLNPANASYQRDIAAAHQRLGDLDHAAGRTADAAEHYHQSLAVVEALTRLDPANATYQQDLALARQRLSELDRAVGYTDAEE